MRWGSKKQHAAQRAAQEQGGGEISERERKSKGKGKASFSFSPLSWLAKLMAKPKEAGLKHVPASTHEDGGAGGDADPAFRSCSPKRTGPVPVAIAPGLPRSSSPRCSPAAAAEAVPRRLSVGNDNADAVAARWHWSRRQRHCSLGSERDLPPLGNLMPFSLSGSTAQPRQAAAAPSDTDAGGRLRQRRNRRRRYPRRSLSGGGRKPFSGRMPPPRVRVRAPELESLAVVRRTRDPQRAFRESMVEMITSSSGNGIAARPEELERLLACYLALNADEHHGCIVKVFRQVWFEHVNQLLPRTVLN